MADDDPTHDDHEASSAESGSAHARAALADILARPTVSLAALIGETELNDHDAMQGRHQQHDDDGDDAFAPDDDGGDMDAEQTAAHRRALLASLGSGTGTDPSSDLGGAAAGTIDGNGDGDGDASRASMYMELHSYLDGLKGRADILPPDFDSIVDHMSAEHVAAAAAVKAAAAGAGAGGASSLRSDRAGQNAEEQSHAGTASSAASSSGAGAPGARARHQFAAPFSPPNAQVLPSPSPSRSGGNRTPSPRSRFDTESKELPPPGVAAAVAASTGAAAAAPASASASASGSRKTATITPLSPPHRSTGKARASPRSQHPVRPPSTSPASEPTVSANAGSSAGSGAGSSEHKSAEADMEADDMPNGPDIGVEDGEGVFNPNAPFDEMTEMGKIAELDALLAEAEGRSAEMDRRLAALMSEPLPALTAGTELNGADHDSASAGGLLLMPPSPSHTGVGASAGADHFSSSAAPDSNDFFMTSVPGGAGLASDPAASATGEDDAVTAAAGPVPPPVVDDPSLWVLEEVEEMDAPVVLALGEGFRPSPEDQVKLDEIDALLNHFRASDSSLPSSYRPRFVHPPIKKLRKKKRVAAPLPPPPAEALTTAVAHVASAASPVPPLAANDDEDDEECEAEATLSPSDPSVAARVALVVHPSASASSPSSGALIALTPGLGGEVSSASAAAGGSGNGSLVEFALENSTIDVSEEEKAELKKLNKKLNRMQKNAAAASSASAAASSNSSAAGRTTDPDALLRRILAKTQASIAASNGGASSSPSASDPSSKFPTFSFPKSTAYNKSVASTDAIFHSLMEEEDGASERASSVAGSSSTARGSRYASSPNHAHGDDGDGDDDDAAELEREIRSAMNDENDIDEEDGPRAEGSYVNDEGEEVEEEEVPRDPRARMDRLAAQVAAIRARVHEDGGDYSYAPPAGSEDADDTLFAASIASAASYGAGRSGSRSGSGSGSGSAKRAGTFVPPAGSRTAASRERTVSAGTRRRGNSSANSSGNGTGGGASSSSLHYSLTARPRSDPAGPGFDLHGLGGSDSPPSLDAAVSSRAAPHSFASSLADRLDQAIGVRPSSSASSSASDSWRSWKPKGSGGGGGSASSSPPPFGPGLSVSASLDGGGDMVGGTASMVRAAARGQQAAAAAAAASLSGASPRFVGGAGGGAGAGTGPGPGSPSPRQVVAPVRQGRPLRALGSAGSMPGSGTAMLAAMQGSPAASLHSARAAAAAAAAAASAVGAGAASHSSPRPLSASSLDLCVGSLPPPISSTQAKLLQSSASRSKLSRSQQLPSTSTGSASWK